MRTNGLRWTAKTRRAQKYKRELNHKYESSLNIDISKTLNITKHLLRREKANATSQARKGAMTFVSKANLTLEFGS